MVNTDLKTLVFKNIFYKHYTGEAIFRQEGLEWRAGGIEDIKQAIDQKEIKNAEYFRSGRRFQIRFFMRNESLAENKNSNVKFLSGFRSHNMDEIKEFVTKVWKLKGFEEKEFSVEGKITGNLKIRDNFLELENNGKKIMDIYYNDIEQCCAIKNDILIENKDQKLPFEHEAMSEVRIHIPWTEMDSFVSPQGKHLNAAEVVEKVREKADLTFSDKNSVVEFKNLFLISPRGRFEASLSREDLYLRGKTFSFKVNLDSFFKMFLLPCVNSGHYLLIYLKKPLVQGKTLYPFLVISFKEKSNILANIDISDTEVKEKYQNKLKPKMEGPSYEVVTKIMKSLSGTKVFMPGSFENSLDEKYVRCAFKASSGLLYPLEASVLFCPKPIIYIQHSEIYSIEFLRLFDDISSTKLFDLAITLKKSKKEHSFRRNEKTFLFTGIEKSEFGPLFKFFRTKPVYIVDKEIHERRILSKSFDGKRFRGNTFVESDAENSQGNSGTSSGEDFDPKMKSDESEDHNSGDAEDMEDE